MSQIKTKRITIRSVINRRDFIRGVEDGRTGAPWPKTLDTSWDYERGRQFGVLHPDVPLKHGRRVSEIAIFRFANSVDLREII